METIATLLIFTSSIFIFFTTPAQSANSCQPVSCHRLHGPTIRFPFRLTNRQPAHCGYPNFNLYCNSENQTMLNLPNSGDFIVDFIDYTRQAILISDTNLCLPNRILNFSLSGSPFVGDNMRDYTFFNCSASWRDYAFSRFVPLPCLSGQNYTVLAMNSHSQAAEVPATCRRIAHVRIPRELEVSMYYWSSVDAMEDLQLVWREPDCVECENRGGVCGFRGSGREIGCSRTSRNAFPRSAMYGIMIGLGVPGLICVVGLISYTCGMIKAMRARRRLNTELPITTFSDHHPAIRSASGLDAPTIESYPKTVLGASRRLPKPSDTTCAICFGDYKPKETLRSIPKCNHYFHADCIDEWLKLNSTCPLCRTSPESSATPSCSSRVSFSSSSSVTTNGH